MILIGTRIPVPIVPRDVSLSDSRENFLVFSRTFSPQLFFWGLFSPLGLKSPIPAFPSPKWEKFPQLQHPNPTNPLKPPAALKPLNTIVLWNLWDFRGVSIWPPIEPPIYNALVFLVFFSHQSAVGFFSVPPSKKTRQFRPWGKFDAIDWQIRRKTAKYHEWNMQAKSWIMVHIGGEIKGK